MRRGFSATSADVKDLQSFGRSENNHELLSFYGAPAMTLPLQTVASPLTLPPRSSSAGFAEAAQTLPPARSPLLDRRRAERSSIGLMSFSSAVRRSPCTTALPLPTSAGQSGRPLDIPASPSTFPPCTASPLTRSLCQQGRWPSVDGVRSTHSRDGLLQHRQSDEIGESPCVTTLLHTPVAPLPYGASGAASARYFPTASSSWRTWRIALSAFCFLNGLLAFLFAWMMRTEQAAFAVVAARRNWDLDERAAATFLAGVYYILLGLILFVDGASAAVVRVARWAGRGVRTLGSMSRHFMRRCSRRINALPLCASLLSHCTRRVSGEASALLPRTEIAGEANAGPLGVVGGGDGLRGAAPAVSRDGSVLGEREPSWKQPVPMKIRRRGN